MNEKHSFWSTVPGILTGVAAVLTAVGALLGVLVQIGIIDLNKDNPPASPIEKSLSGLWTGYHVIISDTGRPTSPQRPPSTLNQAGTYMFFKQAESGIVVLQSSFGKHCTWEGKRIPDCEYYGNVTIDGDNISWEYLRVDNRTTVHAKIAGEQIKGSYQSVWPSSGRQMSGEFLLRKASSAAEHVKSLFQ